MAQGLDLRAEITEAFSLKEKDPGQYSPLNLAFIGDSVFDLVVKTMIVGTANRPVNIQQRKASSLVKAPSQAEMIEALLPELSEEEIYIYRRGRNSKPNTKAKNTDFATYLKATGFEALIGYLYLKDRTDRLIELIKTGIERLS